MRDQVHIETIKAVPSITGTAATIYGKVNGLDWATIAAQCTVGYTLLMGAYLIWKWRREAKKGE